MRRTSHPRPGSQVAPVLAHGSPVFSEVQAATPASVDAPVDASPPAVWQTGAPQVVYQCRPASVPADDDEPAPAPQARASRTSRFMVKSSDYMFADLGAEASGSGRILDVVGTLDAHQ